MNYKISEKKDEVYFKYMPKKITKQKFNKKNKNDIKENPFNILKDLQLKEASLIKNIEDLDFKNSLLSDNLDLDYIETLIRERFLFGKEGEKIYIIRK